MTKHEALNALHVDPEAHERSLVRQGLDQPTFTQLAKYVAKHGPDGVLESACHLTEAQFEKLTAIVKAATPKRQRKMRLGAV